MMGKKLLVSSTLAAVCLTSGCETMSNTAGGGLIGGAAGAGVGAAAAGGKGAVVGGLIGMLTGGLIGNSIDQKEKQQREAELAAAQARPVAPPLGITDVMQMTRTGATDPVIINQIRATNSTYQLSTEDIRLLQTNGVSQAVIIEMQNHPPVVRVVQQPVYVRPAPTVYYVQPAPPPPPVIGVSATFSR
jgi:surface antigen